MECNVAHGVLGGAVSCVQHLKTCITILRGFLFDKNIFGAFVHVFSEPPAQRG